MKRNGTGHWLPHSANGVCVRARVSDWKRVIGEIGIYDDGMREALQAAVRNVLSCTTRNTTAAARTRPIADCV